jgi:hypothetical protein
MKKQEKPMTEEEYADNMPIKERKNEVAMKILSGRLLTEEEFFLAKAWNFLMKHADEKEGYLQMKKAHYEDDQHVGYLCTSNGKINAENHLGENTMCVFGIHREQVKPEHLRDDQKELW